MSPVTITPDREGSLLRRAASRTLEVRCPDMSGRVGRGVGSPGVSALQATRSVS